jgi:hypothetical protein
MLKATGDDGVKGLTNLFNRIISEGKVPTDWARSWITSVYKGKGDALDCTSYRGIKLLEHAMKVFERVIEKRLRNVVQIDDMQCGFRPGKGTTDAIFVVRQLQEKYLDKKRELWMAFVDLEKAFDRVPREVLWWALRKMNVPEQLLGVIVAMYSRVKTAVKTQNGIGDEFEVRVGVHQGSVLSPLLFTIVLDALSKAFRGGLPWEILYADDLVLISESEEDLVLKIQEWKSGFESKGLRVNVAKTKVMRCALGTKVVDDTGKWPCGICRKGVGTNSIQCQSCKKWIHKRCSGIRIALRGDMLFQCARCTGTLKGSVDSARTKASTLLQQDVELERVDKFCYLGDMISAEGGAGDAVRTRVKSAWAAFRELCPILTLRGASLHMKGKLYTACVRSKMIYGSETWPLKVEDKQKLERAENMMVRWMCGVTLKDRISTTELRERLGISSIMSFVRRGRLGWFGHVERKDDDDWVKSCRNLKVSGERGPGRGRKTWDQCVKEDMKELGLKREEALDKRIWNSKVFGGPVLPAQARKCRR